MTGAEIRTERERLGMTQQELATYAGISIATLGLIERGQTTPQKSTIGAIKVALGLAAKRAKQAD